MKVHFLIVDTSCDKFQFLFKVNSTEVSLLPLNSLERAHEVKDSYDGSACWFYHVCTVWFFLHIKYRVFGLLCLLGFKSLVSGSKLKKKNHVVQSGSHFSDLKELFFKKLMSA
jgi:hypothetical protein